ncbi:hypothetical protein PHAVU_003G103700 [Phaseolus vulgaris]|uniref:Uncharacterized protein n=1 Tax=Phaseolus vulgaris TaxID=3885 RepID=V7CA82_PHAVU|nr:hypothetical protein PHAVU_003G103700g [Phaseolus vulgaris]ESW26253.1 hypothetical protein PHAVU_003G103700g [Phaseolus vulgaris]
MFIVYTHTTLGCAKVFAFTTLKWSPLLQLQFPNFQFCTATSTSTSHSRSFVVSYLINNCAFSQETALKASRKLHFSKPQKPDSVLSFFRNHAFSNSHISHILQRQPGLLSCNTQKTLLPKFEFLRSKGASSLDVIHVVTACPNFLRRSLKSHIIPTYEFVRGFLQTLFTEKQIIDFLIQNPFLLYDGRVAPNVKLLLDSGVTHSEMVKLLQRWPRVLYSGNLSKAVQELKQVGFDASLSTFSVALLAKRTVNESKWDEKIDTYKRWGWSQEQVLLAFRRHPFCMLASRDKINAVMSFWVEQAGFNSVDLVKTPGIISLSLRKRIAPRACVLQFLISKGLVRNGASLTVPFVLTEKLFLDKYVKRFKEDSSHLLKLYTENTILGNDNDNTCR